MLIGDQQLTPQTHNYNCSTTHTHERSHPPGAPLVTLRCHRQLTCSCLGRIPTHYSLHRSGSLPVTLYASNSSSVSRGCAGLRLGLLCCCSCWCCVLSLASPARLLLLVAAASSGPPGDLRSNKNNKVMSYEFQQS